MGNSVLDSHAFAQERHATVTKFYTSDAWIEGRAEDQLSHTAKLAGVQHIAAFPDLHPGKHGPVGCAILADRIYPQLIGNDIGCGMTLFQLDLAPRKIKLDKAVRRLRVLGDPTDKDYTEALREVGLASDLFAQSLGTIGGGNHFCELQTITRENVALGLRADQTYLLVHSGSRGLGTAVLNSLEQGAFNGMDPSHSASKSYVQRHDEAVRWALLNRQIIAQRAADALRADVEMIADAPHNLLTPYAAGWLHRKGAALADGELVPLAGTRETPSYLMQPAPKAIGNLGSLAHGAGRKFDRSSMHGRVRAKKSDLAQMQNNPFGGRIICEDKALMVEEAMLAYKNPQSVVDDLVSTGLAKCVARFHPLITFKKTREVSK